MHSLLSGVRCCGHMAAVLIADIRSTRAFGNYVFDSFAGTVPEGTMTSVMNRLGTNCAKRRQVCRENMRLSGVG